MGKILLGQQPTTIAVIADIARDRRDRESKLPTYWVHATARQTGYATSRHGDHARSRRFDHILCPFSLALRKSGFGERKCNSGCGRRCRFLWKEPRSRLSRTAAAGGWGGTSGRGGCGAFFIQVR